MPVAPQRGTSADRPGRTAVICSLEKAPLAMRGEGGTVVHGAALGAGPGALGLIA